MRVDPSDCPPVALRAASHTGRPAWRRAGNHAGLGGGAGGRGGVDAAAAALAAAKLRATPVTNLILSAFDAQTGKQLYPAR